MKLLVPISLAFLLSNCSSRATADWAEQKSENLSKINLLLFFVALSEYCLYDKLPGASYYTGYVMDDDSPSYSPTCRSTTKYEYPAFATRSQCEDCIRHHAGSEHISIPRPKVEE